MLRLCWIIPYAMIAVSPACAIEAHYETYAAGIQVIDLDASIDVAPDRYRLILDYRTVGPLNLVLRSRQNTVVEGRFVGTRPAPERFFSTGILRGATRVTQIDYFNGQPTIRQLEPPNDAEREQVPSAQQADTIDTLSAVAELMRQVNGTGRCEGRVTTFDGRRLSVLEVRTAGEQDLDATGRSSFAGRALRCDFVGRQIGGFMLDEDRERLRQPQTGTAWFAPMAPGGTKIPVRIAFRTRWFGEATMYLAEKPVR